ncbi:DUF4296 domain-containing protein [Chryseobacterium taiwanense]|nr:DUF4296 domain-containing protein [Chryseobacterium taiwanense]
MKKTIFIFILMCLFSCGDYIDKPKNLIPKDQMAEILADLAINDQATYMYPNTNLEAGTRYVLKSHNVKSVDFVESFKYYVIKQKMQGITEDAQVILLEKDPKADKFIKDKLKKNGPSQKDIPVLSR